MSRIMSQDTKITKSSGNVFADLGLPEADELLAKAELARQISSIIEHRHLTQTAAAALLGTNQPRVSGLVRGRLEKFSMDQLLQFLVALDRDVKIVVKKKPRNQQHARLLVDSV
jgi:predicted XRE-type DNA-binding protein